MNIEELLRNSINFECLIGTKLSHQAATTRLLLLNNCNSWMMNDSIEGLNYWIDITDHYRDFRRWCVSVNNMISIIDKVDTLRIDEKFYLKRSKLKYQLTSSLLMNYNVYPDDVITISQTLEGAGFWWPYILDRESSK